MKTGTIFLCNFGVTWYWFLGFSGSFSFFDEFFFRRFFSTNFFGDFLRNFLTFCFDELFIFQKIFLTYYNLLTKDLFIKVRTRTIVTLSVFVFKFELVFNAGFRIRVLAILFLVGFVLLTSL